MKTFILSLFLYFSLGIGSLSAQAAFDSNFDNGRVDSAYFGGDAYVLAPIANLHARVTGIKGDTTVFKIYDHEGYRLRDYHRMVYRYEGDSAWHFFENGSKTGSRAYYYFNNSSPFLYDTLYLAYWYPWTWQDQQDYIAALRGSSAHLRNLGPRGTSYEGRPLYGYEITDTSYLDCYKQKMVITARQHPIENINGYFVKGLTDYLLYGSDSTAQYLRKHYRFFIYPMLNPDGVFHGSGQNVLGQGLNREWAPGLSLGGTPEIDSIRPYLYAETGGQVDYAVDIHSNPGSNIRYYWWGINDSSYLDPDSVARAKAYVQGVESQDAAANGGQSLFQNYIQGNGINGSLTATNWFFATMGAHAFTFEPTSTPIRLSSDQVPASRMESAGASLVKGFYGLFAGVAPMQVRLQADSLTASVAISGGQAPYTVQWVGPQTYQGDSLQAAAPGTYQVSVSDAGGCSWQGKVEIKLPTALEASMLDELKVYPNPSEGIIRLEWPAHRELLALSLWDLQGRQVMSLPTDSREFVLSDLPSGTYLLHFRFEEGSVQKQLRIRQK
jgi:hypothetical protein